MRGFFKIKSAALILAAMLIGQNAFSATVCYTKTAYGPPHHSQHTWKCNSDGTMTHEVIYSTGIENNDVDPDFGPPDCSKISACDPNSCSNCSSFNNFQNVSHTPPPGQACAFYPEPTTSTTTILKGANNQCSCVVTTQSVSNCNALENTTCSPNPTVCGANTTTTGGTTGSTGSTGSTGATGSTTGTSGGATPSPTATIGPPATPTSTPHITCPSGSKDNPSDPNDCKCLVEGQIFTQSGSSGSCACPSGYEVVIVDPASSKAECRPKVGKEFFRNISDPASDFFPVCGKGRAPTNSTGGILRAASSSVPNSTAGEQQVSPQGFTYKYASGSSTAPKYLYQGYDHCACTYQDFPVVPTKVTGTESGTLSNGKNRFYTEEYNTIITQDSNASVPYGAVAIAKSEAIDGRLGSVYGSGYSQCGCPNVNEKMVPIDPSEPYASGVICQPAVENSPYRVLTQYRPEIHDVDASNTQVINRANEVIHANGHVIGQILLPNGGSTQLYQRKIWACMYPFTVNVSSGKCEFDPTKNACNEGNGSDVLASEVSNGISGPSKSDRFLNAINKKLACCLNQFGTSGSDPVKFDCVTNDIKSYSDFDALWSSADTAEQGGQLNALMLTNAQGKWLSGFYTLDGTRCEEFSEFAGTIQPGVVNPVGELGAQMKRAGGKLDPNAFEAKGSAIPLPGSGAGSGSSAYSYMLGKVIGLGKTVPSSTADKRRCPVLVRAAMVATCPADGGSPLAAYNGQCAAAMNVKVHIRAEQVWEIAGQPKMKTTDTVIDRIKNQAGDISIDRIISNKYGNACPAPMVTDPTTGACRY